MIKEAAFLGSEYIASGSDCGNVFIWHRSGRLVYLGKGDQYIVNCVQPNPHMSTLACSGIDQHIRLFTPTCPEKADGFTLNTDQTFMAEICNENLRRAANTNDLQYSVSFLFQFKFCNQKNKGSARNVTRSGAAARNGSRPGG